MSKFMAFDIPCFADWQFKPKADIMVITPKDKTIITNIKTPKVQ